MVVFAKSGLRFTLCILLAECSTIPAIFSAIPFFIFFSPRASKTSDMLWGSAGLEDIKRGSLQSLYCGVGVIKMFFFGVFLLKEILVSLKL